jgi:hypothetical protein
MTAPTEDKSDDLKDKFYNELEKRFISSLSIGRTFFCEVLMQNLRKMTFLHEIFGAFLHMNIENILFVQSSRIYHIKI